MSDPTPPLPSEIFLRPIGILRADFRQKFGTPRQGSLALHSRAHLELAPQWRGRGILSGLESFSHAWLISFLHLSHGKRQRGKIHPPRLKGEKIGVMGSRSPHRPNNIGLTLARISKCEGDQLELAEVDLVDGTPLLDIKPYLAAADRPEVFSGGWTDRVTPTSRACHFTPESLAELQTLVEGGVIDDAARVQALIHEMLALDPRPPAYLGRADAQFAIWVAGLNVVFRFLAEEFTVTKIEAAPFAR